MYQLIRKLLFSLEPELSHRIALQNIRYIKKLGLNRLLFGQLPVLPTDTLGLNFPNPVGLAAGLDKNGDYIHALSALGFGFIEVGTVTPKAQTGNPKPRLFRLAEDQAIINRMGFNNKGVDYLKKRLQRSSYQGILGINIGKNKSTPEQEANNDYVYCLRGIYQYASYITINISSPNTPGLRDLQKRHALESLLSTLMAERDQLADRYQHRVPLLVKIAPDLAEPALREIAQLIMSINLDGVIVSNTTITRENIKDSNHADESGGLSGKPLLPLATYAQSILYSELNGRIPIVGVGGILHAEDAIEKIEAGADLIQIYTGFIYHGPKLIRNIVNAVSENRPNRKGFGG